MLDLRATLGGLRSEPAALVVAPMGTRKAAEPDASAASAPDERAAKRARPADDGADAKREGREGEDLDALLEAAIRELLTKRKPGSSC